MAQLLIEISTGDAAAKRQLRLALAGTQGPKEAAQEITMRLISIARVRTFVDWQNRKPLVKNLETQRQAIMEQVAPQDSREAPVLLWRFMGLATPVFQHCDDSSGIDIFHQACADLGEVAKLAGSEPEALARQVLDALQDNGFGTLFTAVYIPQDGALTLRWPGEDWQQLLDNFTPGSRTIRCGASLQGFDFEPVFRAVRPYLSPRGAAALDGWALEARQGRADWSRFGQAFAL